MRLNRSTMTKTSATNSAITHAIKIAQTAPSNARVSPVAPAKAIIFRSILGEVLRARRNELGMTLREVSSRAKVSLGYLSEIERGQKEASSELLASICVALDLRQWQLFDLVSVAMMNAELPPLVSAPEVN